MTKILWFTVFCAVSPFAWAHAQESVASPAPAAGISAPALPDQTGIGSYVLGPGDDLNVKVLGVADFTSAPSRVDTQGDIHLPLVGSVHAAGLTVEALEGSLARRLKAFVVDPAVVITIAGYRSQPVTVLGAVTHPGVHQLAGHKTLFEIISEVDGLRPDAGYTIKITRQRQSGPIPLPDCELDPTGQFYAAEVSVRSVMEARDPRENIAILPHDIISVPKGQVLYVLGAVKKSGGYVLGDAASITVLQALALADGLDNNAATRGARIMRVVPGKPQRDQIPVDVKQIFAGKSADVRLEGGDILFVPSRASKRGIARLAETAVSTVTGAVLYRAIY